MRILKLNLLSRVQKGGISPFFQIPPTWLFQFAELPTHSKFITLACLSLLKVFMRIVERFHFSSAVEWTSSVKIMTAGALGFSFPFNGMRLLVLICFYVLKSCVQIGITERETNCSLGIILWDLQPAWQGNAIRWVLPHLKAIIPRICSICVPWSGRDTTENGKMDGRLGWTP